MPPVRWTLGLLFIAAATTADVSAFSPIKNKDLFAIHRRIQNWYSQLPAELQQPHKTGGGGGGGGDCPLPRQPPTMDELLHDIPSALNAFISGTTQCFGVPGLTSSVVANDQMIYSGQFGVRDLSTQQPMTPFTRIGIGSTTKAFTATGLALAVDRAVLNWMDPVNKHVPGFSMFDPVASANVVIKDLLSHRTGLPRHDFIWATGIEETIELGVSNVRYLQPNLPFRDQFEYNNWCWSTAGVALEYVMGSASWGDIITNQLLTPIGMLNSTTDPMEAISSGDYATGNVYVAGSNGGNASISDYQPLPIELDAWNLAPIAPAGIISSNAVDMAHWMRFHLNSGMVNGVPIVSSVSLLQTRAPVITIGEGMAFYYPHNGVSYDTRSYAFGWLNGQYRGFRWLWHDGGTSGQSTLLTLLTDVGVGVFTSINGQQGQEELLNMLITYYALDLALGLPPWLTVQSACAMKHIADKERLTEQHTAAAQHAENEPTQIRAIYTEAMADAKSQDLCAAVTASSTSVADATNPYAGTYTSQFAGTITVASDMTGTLNRMDMELIPYPWPNPPPAAYGCHPVGWGGLVAANSSIPLQFAPACPNGSIPGLYVQMGEAQLYYFSKAA